VSVVSNEQWAGQGSVTDLRDFGIIIVAMDSGNFSGKSGGFLARELEPSSSEGCSSAFKLEAGKFYKTRDGRKVGPAFVSGDVATFGSKSNHASAVWSDDGRSSHRDDKTSLKDNDIIAEWIDEPVVASNDNAQPKFKVGDRVRFVQTYGLPRVRGKIAEVVSTSGWGIQISLPGEGLSTESPDSLEPVATTPTTSIVALIENGQPKPSAVPFVHSSTGAAETEAKRLAGKHKGKKFGVFTLTTTHEEAAPVYDQKWQNLAALGLNVDAIKELRDLASLDLLSAKRAVEAFVEKAA